MFYIQINDKLSGTTATAVCFHGGRLSACNLGDSRVILGHRVDSKVSNTSMEEEKLEETNVVDPKKPGSLVAIPLTRDQTCYRQDERERIVKMGGEVQSIDQLESVVPIQHNWGDFHYGEKIEIHGDPPRIWVRGKKYPGCAFTRSLGDSVGEGIGIIADPEILTCDVTENDEILVIGSDGVFAFLTNQEVINICQSCNSPLEASEAVTKAAYDRWIQNDSRSDDITVIVCFLSSTYKPPAELVPQSTMALVESVGAACVSAPAPLSPSTITTPTKVTHHQ
jgi:serine/threonine protein phosphatase PrpC